ncbi:hypothetical protein VPH35_077911 [Triticum aestivum]
MEVEECVAAFDNIREEPEQVQVRTPVEQVGPGASPTRASRTSTGVATFKAANMMDKAMALKASKGLQGAISKPIMRSMSSFKVLSLASDAHLLRVAKESNVILGTEDRSPLEVLETFIAQEEAQAAIAETIARRDLARTALAESKAQVLGDPTREKVGPSGHAVSGHGWGRGHGRGHGRGSPVEESKLATGRGPNPL